MKKRELLDIYTFLANGVKIGALANASTRSAFISFFRGIKRIADPITKELNDALVPPLGDASEETRKQIMDEEVTETLPKINEGALLEAIAESKIDAPVNIILDVFDQFFE